MNFMSTRGRTEQNSIRPAKPEGLIKDTPTSKESVYQLTGMQIEFV